MKKDFLKTLNQKLKMALMTLSVSTMVMMPVAQGKQAENLSKSKIQEAFQTLGLNKSITFAEFYSKNKHLYPPRIQQHLEPFVKLYGQEPMPSFEVSTTKSSKGESVPVVRLSSGGQLHNLQFFGEDGRYVKFNNTNLTEVDIVNFSDMFTRLYQSDSTVRKQMGAPYKGVSYSKIKKFLPLSSPASASISGYPEITKASWKKMTQMQRAQHMVNLRTLWLAADKVLSLKESGKIKSKKKSAELFNLEKWNYFVAFLNQEVFAAQSINGKCVVAGYIGSYGKVNGRVSCQYPTDVKNDCGSGYQCNPTIYGYDSSNKAFCVGNRSNLQTATHFNGACDSQMPLSSEQLSLPQLSDPKSSARYSEAVIKKNYEQALNDKNFKQLTENYLKSMLNAQNKDLAAAFSRGEISDALLESFKKIQENFNGIISAARTDCAQAADSKQIDPNFWGACDQLHRRFLLVSEYLNKYPGCLDKSSKVDPNTLKCACPSGAAVNPGQACVQPQQPQPPSTTPPQTGVEESGQCNPACDIARGEKCVLAGENANGAQAWECRGASDQPEKESIWKKLLNFGKKALPWVLGGAALFAAYKIWSPKKPKLKAAGDICPNGATAPCAQTCELPKALLANGSCGCAECPLGQSITDVSKCTCSTATATDTVLTCSDGVTQVADLTQCPSADTYTCWDGSTVSNPINCPEKLPASSTGGTTQ